MRAGDVVWNPLTGEKAMIVEASEESGGARIVADFAVEADGFVPGGEHVHDRCAEHLEVRAGQIMFVLGREERTLAAGERVTIVPGTWHRWCNAGQGEVRSASASSHRCASRRRSSSSGDSAPMGTRMP